MVKESKKKTNKPRGTSKKDDHDTARAGAADESSTSQAPQDPVREGSGDEDTVASLLSQPFTDQQDKAIAEFFSQHPCFYDMSHADYKNKRKRDGLLLEFAQSMFASGKCILSLKYIFHTVVFLLQTKVTYCKESM